MVCDVALGFNRALLTIATTHSDGKSYHSAINLILQSIFSQCGEAGGRVHGHSRGPHCDQPVFCSYSAAFLGAVFAGHIKNFLEDI